ncbi:phosphatase PAP2 family protein [Mariniblastus sp.]|nr:phosphatase PAP2 family protein [Mariniblastus sp.]
MRDYETMTSAQPLNRNDHPEDAHVPAKRIWLHALWLTGLGFILLPYDFSFYGHQFEDSIPGDLTRVITLSEIFAHGFGVFLTAIAIWVLAASHRRAIPRVVICAIWPAISVHLLKLLFARRRPLTYLQADGNPKFPETVDSTWLGFLSDERVNFPTYAIQSFPSAHTATAWGLAIGLAWLFPRGRWLFFSLALLASIQRITSMSHWPSDVCWGAAIAFLMAGAVTQNWGIGHQLSKFETKKATDLDSITTV